MNDSVQWLRHLVLPVFLVSCASVPEDSGPLSRIEDELDSVVASTAREPVAIPDSISDALLPPVTDAIAEYSPAAEKFDISVRDLDAQEFYQALVKGTPYNVVVHPGLAGKISLELKNVTLEEVMNLVRDLYGYEYKRDGFLYRVLPGGLRTEIFRINYLNISRKGDSEIQVSAGQVTDAGPTSRGGTTTRGNLSSPQSGAQRGTRGVVGTKITTKSESDFWGQLTRTLELIIGRGEGRSVVTSPEAGIAVVRASSRELRTVEEFLARTELIMQRQVILEAKILEVTLNDSYSQGISWSSLSKLSTDLDLEGNRADILNLSQVGRNIINPDQEGVFAATLKVDNFDVLVKLLGTQGDVQVLSSPRIATVNNQKAVIKVGSDEFFVTEIRVDQNNNINTNQTNTDVELTPFFSGIALDVTPQISEDGRIILHVHPSISEVTDQTKIVSLGDRDLTLPLALSTIRETDSVISALSGQVVVIGGLISDVRQRDEASVPGLGRLPLFGNLFKQKNRKSRKSELVILLKPTLASPDNVLLDIQNVRERIGVMQGSSR